MTEIESQLKERLMIYRVRDIAREMRVTARTVRRWVADGLLKPRGYRRLGGTALEMLFTNAEIEEFLDRYLLLPPDIHSNNRRAHRADELRGLIGVLRLYAGKASAAKVAKTLNGQ